MLAGNGSFVVDITTGGIDEQADMIAVYALPLAFIPPVALGANPIFARRLDVDGCLFVPGGSAPGVWIGG